MVRMSSKVNIRLRTEVAASRFSVLDLPENAVGQGRIDVVEQVGQRADSVRAADLANGLQLGADGFRDLAEDLRRRPGPGWPCASHRRLNFSGKRLEKRAAGLGSHIREHQGDGLRVLVAQENGQLARVRYFARGAARD